MSEGRRREKEIERAEVAEKDRVEKARKVQDKADKGERDRVFQVLLKGSARSKGCCEPCNYHVRTNNGEYRPCKMGYKDSGPGKEVCAECSDSHYVPKK